MNSSAEALPKWLEPAEKEGRIADSYGRSLKLAFEMHNAGRGDEAAAICRVLLHIRPHDAQLLFLFGMVLHKAKRDQEAVRWLSLATLYEPDSARIFSGLGCAWYDLGDYSRAVGAFDRAVELDPETAAHHYNLGRSSYGMGRMERARENFQRAVEMDPRDHASWNNLGKCLKELNRLDESLAAYDRALELAPDYPLARYGRALSLMTAGRLAAGFQEYEWRWYTMKRRTFFEKWVWQGDTAPGKTLFIHAEQGFGDAIQMVRFVAKARERVGRVILECRPELLTLLQYSRCADTVMPFGAPIPKFDFFIPMMSLPRALGVTMETIPSATPYLQAPLSKSWTAERSGHLKVGLAWAGNPEHNQDAARSIRLQKLAPILQVPGVHFHSLQRVVPAADESWLRLVSEAVATDATFNDFLETAAFVAELDLVIAVDTAVAHLAGALGKPVWLLLPYSPDWRWFLDRGDTPWYPTMQLFRQTERGQWDEPILRVAEALRQKAAAGSPRRLQRLIPALVEPRHKGSSRLTPFSPARLNIPGADGQPIPFRRGGNWS